MARPTLPESRIHPAIRARVAGYQQDILKEVADAVATHDVVVVGMEQNPYPRAARKALDEIGQAYHYLAYGSYLNSWRRRLALKMWTGWPTLPLVFVKGQLVGGADDLKALIASGEFKTLLAAPRQPD